MALKDQYFKHDYNASEDDKIVILIDEMGMEGYGIWNFLLERLAKAGGTLQKKMIRILADKMKVDQKKLEQVINNYDLLVIEGDKFTSKRLKNDIDKRETIIESNSKGGKTTAEGKVNKLKSTFEERKKAFGHSLTPFVKEYGEQMIRKFFDYWSEANTPRTKMLWETMKAFELKKRLATWKRKDEERKFGDPEQQAIVARNPGDYRSV